MAAVTKGITISFSNTPQAKDDPFADTDLTEDSLGIQYLDVMANDLGGNAKTLYSLDDGTSAVSYTNPQGGTSPTDLLTQDTARAEATSTDYSALGARIWITVDGKVGYDGSTFSPAVKAQLQQLAAGEYATDSFTYAIQLGNGTLSWATATVQIAGANDPPVAIADTNAADAVVESGVNPGNTPFAGDAAAAGNVLTNDTDVDEGATKTVSAVNGNAGNVGVTITGTYGSVVIGSDGSYTYTLNNADADTNALAQGANASDVFNYTVSDQFGATSTSTLTINLTGTNDAPVITGSATIGSVTEDTASQATGQLTAIDVDQGAQKFWSVAGNAPSGNADYHFLMDSFTVTRNGQPFFQDNFSDGVPPPSGPNGGTTYTGIGTASFTESGGRLHFDSSGAVSFIGAGAPDPFIGENAVLRSNIDPSSGEGLKSSTDFTVSGVFDLVLPDSLRENYGIRLTDRHVGGNGTPPDQLGDNVVEVRVHERTDGVVVVRLAKVDFVHDTNTTLQAIVLAPPSGADQIRLNLAHSTANTGKVTVSFDYLHGGTIVETQNFTAAGQIFQGENWVRAEMIASAPQLGGTYGSLNVDQTGTWIYALDNNRAATQALAQDQHATDTFTVKVADEYGAFDTRAVSIDVVGKNDAPIMQTGPVSRSLTEDINVNPSGNLVTFGDSQFSDVDLTDTHTLAASLSSATLSDGGSVPAGLSPLLNNAVAMTPLDPATGDGHAQFRWDFALANSAIQFLAAGQTLTLAYNLAATDNYGGTATQPQVVTIRITGTNDAPVITTAADGNTGTVVEAGNLSDGTVVPGVPSTSGTLSSSDVDTGATATWSVAGGPTTFWSTSNNGDELIKFDTVTGATTVVGNFGVTHTWGLAFAPDGSAYTLQGSNATLAKVNLSTGALTTIGGPGGGFGFALDFGPDGTLYAVNGGNQIYSVDTTTGAFTLVRQLSGITDNHMIMDITFDLAGHLYAVAGPPQGNDDRNVYQIDLASGAATIAFTTPLSRPMAIAANGAGNLIVASSSSNQFELINTSNGTGTIISNTGANATFFHHGGDIHLSAFGNATGTYGAFAINPATDAWTYNLANGQANVQALTQGQTVTDSVTALVTDDKGATASQDITVTIIGVNG